MPVITMLQRSLRTACGTMHATRLRVLWAAVDAVTHGGRLTLTGIGRTLRSQTTVKHTIKRVDRLLSNPHLHRDRALLYTTLIQQVLGPQTRPVIIVDWSDLTPDRRWQVLRASLPVGGRALTLYDEVHPLQKLGNRRVQQAFLRTLHRLLPAKVTPILVTDAGFRSPWFLAVTQLGWTFVGRVRNRDWVCFASTSSWVPCKSLYAHARATPTTLGLCELVRSRPFSCRLVLVKEPCKHRDSHLGLGAESAVGAQSQAGCGESRSVVTGDLHHPRYLSGYADRGVLSDTDANRRGLSRHEVGAVWLRIEWEPHHAAGAMDDALTHWVDRTPGGVARRPCDNPGQRALSVPSQYHTKATRPLGGHVGAPSYPTGA